MQAGHMIVDGVLRVLGERAHALQGEPDLYHPSFPLWERISELDPSPSAGFRIGREFDLRQLGLLHYLVASAENLSSAFEVLRHCIRVVTVGSSMNLSGSDGGVRFQAEFQLIRGPNAAHAGANMIDFFIVITHRLVTSVLPDFRAESLCLAASGAPYRDLEPYQTFFGCPVVHAPGALASAWSVFDPRFLDAPFQGAEEILYELLRQQAETLEPRSETIDRTLCAYTDCLENGNDSLTRVSRVLGVSERSYYRMLKELGLSHRSLQSTVRNNVALRFVGSEPLKKVAARFGLTTRTLRKSLSDAGGDTSDGTPA